MCDFIATIHVFIQTRSDLETRKKWFTTEISILVTAHNNNNTLSEKDEYNHF